jgi:hypothetical protein
MSDSYRLTLVACDDSHGEIDWNFEDSVSRRVVFIDGGPLLRLAIRAAIMEPTLDTERLILDRSASAETFLELLATLPPEFSGDVLRIDEPGCGFLSATGRGGDRVLYTLQPHDVRFYLATHGLARFEESLEKIA